MADTISGRPCSLNIAFYPFGSVDTDVRPFELQNFIDHHRHHHIINFSANHVTNKRKHMAEQQQKAAREATRLNELTACDNIKCY